MHGGRLFYELLVLVVFHHGPVFLFFA